MSITIKTHNLTRRFGDLVAVDQLDLSINSGEIFGLLGPNAAGKSTIIRLLAGILRPDSGDASILGLNLFTLTEKIKRRIGYVAQQFALYPEITSALMKVAGVQLVNQFGNELRIITETSVTADELQKIISKYHKESFKVASVTPGIEDAFMSLTSNGGK